MIEFHAPTYRIAAIGDLHIRRQIPAGFQEQIERLHELADVLVITGDITNNGLLSQAELAAGVLRRASLPMLAVLGNHDRRCLRKLEFRAILSRAGVTFIDGSTYVLDHGRGLGFAGIGGSGGGFWPDEGPDTISRRVIQRLAVRARWEAARLDEALASLDTAHKVVVSHFAPTMDTLGTEPVFKDWLLGNIELARVIDRHRVDIVLHGHAHHGNPIGHTLGGTLVRNVAHDVVEGGIVIHRITPRRPLLPCPQPAGIECVL